MFDIGFWELVILFGIGLIVLGPERLPKVAMQIGNWAGQARRMARTLTTQMRAELDVDISKPFTPSYTPNKPAGGYKRPGVNDLRTDGAGSASGGENSGGTEGNSVPDTDAADTTPAEPPKETENASERP